MPLLRCPDPACGANCSLDEPVGDRTVRCPKCGGLFPNATDPFPVLPAEFGRYRLLRLLGRGVLGVVYLAQDSHLGRQVSLKVPSFGPGESPPQAEAFLRAARAAATLDHPHICTVFDVGQIDSRPFFTRAYLEGKPLAQEIDPDEPMPQARAAEIIRKLALALEHAHGKGIVHLDLKPANVMLDASGAPVVMDFGGGKQATDAKEGGFGIPTYLAPEQVRKERAAIGPATDVYALGVILFELLTGSPPYTGASRVVLESILSAPVPSVQESRPDGDPQLEAICRKALAKSPAKRFASMAELANALQEALTTPAPGRLPVTVAPGTAKTATPRDERRVPRRKTASPTLAPSARDTAEEPRARPKPPKKKKKQMGGGVVALSVVGVMLLVLAVGGVLASRFLAPRKPATEDSASKPSTTTTRSQPRPETLPVSGKAPPDGVAGTRPALLDCTTTEGVAAPDMRRAQEAWAKYLGRAVEEEVEIAGGVKMTFVLIPPGKFLMGSPPGEIDQQPDETLHPVTLTDPFYLGRAPVTQKQYEVLTGRNPSQFRGDLLPAESVSWEDARDYAAGLTTRRADKHLYRLPTEAEWEYACRGGRPASRPFGVGDGTRLSSREANFKGDTPYGGAASGPWRKSPSPVGSYPANALGLVDMHGNVFQWCADWHEPYSPGEVTNPTGPREGQARILRGGSWGYFGGGCRAAHRGRNPPAYLDQYDGFRLARSLPSEVK